MAHVHRMSVVSVLMIWKEWLQYPGTAIAMLRGDVLMGRRICYSKVEEDLSNAPEVNKSLRSKERNF